MEESLQTFLAESRVSPETSEDIGRKGFRAWNTIAANETWEELMEDLKESNVVGVNRSLAKSLHKESIRVTSAITSNAAPRRCSNPFTTPEPNISDVEDENARDSSMGKGSVQGRQRKHQQDPGLAGRILNQCWTAAYNDIPGSKVGPNHNLPNLCQKNNKPLIQTYFMIDDKNYLDFQAPAEMNQWRGAFKCTFPGCKWNSTGNDSEASNGWRNLSNPKDFANVVKHAETGHYTSKSNPFMHWNAVQRSLGMEAPQMVDPTQYPGEEVPLPESLLCTADDLETQELDDAPQIHEVVTGLSAPNSVAPNDLPVVEAERRVQAHNDLFESPGGVEQQNEEHADREYPRCEACHKTMHDCDTEWACPSCRTFTSKSPQTMDAYRQDM
jgi:hypothetical protein